jgi:hypothetical protein
MVTPMTEQPGQQDPADRPAGDSTPRDSTARDGTGRSSQAGQPARTGSAARGGQSGRPGTGQSRQGLPGADMLTDFQRWLLRSGAKSMRKELTGQVRKTFNGGRPDQGDIWDIATTEIPPEVGESPECQWCPVCRAARAMRDSGPGLGGQLYGAGDAVASAAADVIGKLDSFLSRSGGGPAQPGRNGGRSAAGQGSAGSTPPARPPAAGATDIAAGEGTETSADPAPPGGWDPPGAPVVHRGQQAGPDAWSEAVAEHEGPEGSAGESAHEPDSRG